MRFRLALYDTDDENKYAATRRYEYLGDKEAIFYLWYQLTRTLHNKHVEIFSIDGRKLNPEQGLSGLTDYNL